MRKRDHISWRSIVLALILCLFIQAAPAAVPIPDFHADVAPVLREYCAGCHNEDEYDGDFSVETFRALMRGGESGEAIVPGHAAKSLLIQSVTKQTKPRMPPKKEPQPSEEEVAVLEAWIEAGAPGPAPQDDASILSTLTVPGIAAVPGVDRAITAAAFSPDGKHLAVAGFRSVELRDAASGKTVRVLGGHEGKVNAVHFSRDGNRIVTASGITGLRGVATLWNAGSGTRIREFGEGEHRDILYDAELSPDGKVLATAGYDRRIILWDTASGDEIRRIEVHNGAIFDLAFSPDGTILASASGDETVKLWRAADGTRLDTLNQPQGEQYAVAFTPDGRFIVAAGADNRIRLWRLVSRDRPRINPLVHARFSHEDDILDISVTPDGTRLVSSSADGSIKLWSLPRLEQLKMFGNQPDLAAALALAPDGGSFTAARMDGSIQRYALGAAGKGVAAPRPSSRATAAASSRRDAAAESGEVSESEPNDAAETAATVDLPVTISGVIGSEGDADVFRFRAKAGEAWVVEVDAARSKSLLDSKIEVLDSEGEPIESVVLQAVRDSWFTFRGKDSKITGDFRLHNWREMELNEYLYANGEVSRLWLYPRGPDSGFKVYPGFGARRTFFGTSGIAHPLGEPCYIVRPLPAGSDPSPNGLPVFRLYYENDDESQQRWETDSQLIFNAPADGEYLARIVDVRGFGGEDYFYEMTVRPRQPDFEVELDGLKPSISPGSGKEFTLKAERLDGFEGEIRVDVTGLPEGFTASTPVIIEAGQHIAFGVINAASDAVAPAEDAAESVRLTATATIGGREVTHDAGKFEEITLGKPAKVLVEILPDGESGVAAAEPGKPVEFTIAPGETITARVKAERIDFEERIDFGKDDSGRNLPHGLYVDNIGLNGLMIVEGQSERQFFITAAKWVPETTRLFHLRITADGRQASRPAIIRVVAEDENVARRSAAD